MEYLISCHLEKNSLGKIILTFLLQVSNKSKLVGKRKKCPITLILLFALLIDLPDL
jgi:hypothetical protein